MYKYIYWEDVQEQLYTLARQGLKRVSFYDAFLNISTSKVQRSETLPMPNFYTKKDILKNPAVQMPAILQYIHEHHNSLSLEELAGIFNYNAEYLSKKLKYVTGKSFQTLLTEERIFIAVQLIINTNLTIEEIGEQVGYNSPVTFSRAFKNTIGIPLGQYRKDYRIY